MELDPKDPRVLGAGGGILVLLLGMLVWGLTSSRHASQLAQDAAAAKERQADAERQLDDAHHLLEVSQALADKRGQERDALAGQVRDLTLAQSAEEKRLKTANDAEAASEAARDHAVREADMARSERSSAVAERDHQHQMWREAQDRYEDLMKTYQQLREEKASQTDASKPAAAPADVQSKP